jgi:hypothetical protein
MLHSIQNFLACIRIIAIFHSSSVRMFRNNLPTLCDSFWMLVSHAKDTLPPIWVMVLYCYQMLTHKFNVLLFWNDYCWRRPVSVVTAHAQKVGITLTLYSLILEVFISNLGQDTNYSEPFLAFRIPSQKTNINTVPLLCNDQLPSTSFPVHHSSSLLTQNDLMPMTSLYNTRLNVWGIPW